MSVLALIDPCYKQRQHQTFLLLEQASKITISPSDLMLRSRLSERR
ncbi:hypothetical protein AFAE65S_02631 [Alcaligenes phenolicus]